MKIGITKFGTIIDEKFGLESSNGAMLEIFNLVNILSKEHEIFITNNLRKPITFKEHKNEKLDVLIVFNGPIGINNTKTLGKKTLSMLERYTWPVIKTINDCECPFIYIQPDVRYNIDRISKQELLKQPNKIINLLGDENYFGFDKIWLYEREIFRSKKENKFGLMYNDTNDKKTKKLISYIEFLKKEGIDTELKGKFKQIIKENTGVLKEREYHLFLRQLKYTVNIASNKLQITPRIWDCFLNGVIAFTEDFDKGYKVLKKDDYLRITDAYDLSLKVNELQQDSDKYENVLNRQYSLIKDEYLDGTFILNKFNELFKTL